MSKAKALLTEHIIPRSSQLPADIRKQFRPDQQVEMSLSGPEGGTFTLLWENAELKLREGPADTPVIRTKGTARGFLDLMTGKFSEYVDIRKLAETSQFMLDPMVLFQPKKLELLKTIKGTLCIQYCDGSAPNDDILEETRMAFNGEAIDEDDPRCTVLIPIGKLERVAKGEVTPPQLMMAGGMRVYGDTQMVIQMSPLLR
jgi:hypothetical protein